MWKGFYPVALAVAFSAACSGTTPAETTRAAVAATTATTPSPPVPSTTTTSTTSTTTNASPSPSTTGVPGDVVAMGLGIGDEYYPFLGNPGYDVQHYDLALEFDPANNHLTAMATIRAISIHGLPTFNLDFDGLRVDGVRVDGNPALFVHADEEITIRPATPIPPGVAFVTQVEYSGTPGPQPTDALPFNIGWVTALDGSEAFVVAEPDNAHTWFPSNDHPRDKATFLFEITVPAGLVAVANGVPPKADGPKVGSVPDGGTTTWRWEMSDPMATYLATVVIGEFDIVVDDTASEHTDVPLRHVLPSGTSISTWPGLERQGEMMAFLEGLFGPYPFDVYGIAIVAGFGNALENQTLSIFGTRMTNPVIFERALVHELAHQWFGDSVSPGLWRDIWLNEGFASYAEWLWIESEHGRETLESAIEAERTAFKEAGVRPPGDQSSDDLFNQSVYRVGAMTLHALRLSIGDEAFFETLRTYHRQFQGSTATTADFVAVAEAVSGSVLADLFDSWLFGDEIPEFE